MRQRLFFGLFSGATVALLAASAALAGTLAVTATISGASGMSLTLPSNPSVSVTLDGADQVATWSAPLGVNDARGTGAGWNLTIAATDFSDLSGHSLAPGTVSAVTSTCQVGNTCTAPGNLLSYPLTLGGTASKFFNADAATGLGSVTVTPTMSVTIPGNAYAGPYTSTVSLAAVSGP
jgi:hypothetical protein